MVRDRNHIYITVDRFEPYCFINDSFEKAILNNKIYQEALQLGYIQTHLSLEENPPLLAAPTPFLTGVNQQTTQTEKKVILCSWTMYENSFMLHKMK